MERKFIICKSEGKSVHKYEMNLILKNTQTEWAHWEIVISWKQSEALQEIFIFQAVR